MSAGVTIPSFTHAWREHPLERYDERRHVLGRFGEPPGLDQVDHRLGDDAEQPDRDRAGLRRRRGDRVVLGPHVADEVGELAADARSQAVDLR